MSEHFSQHTDKASELEGLPAAKIAPSILTADFTRLGEQIREAEAAGADYIHVDVMDGMFVPNITLGPLIVEAIRRSTTLPLEVHLMINEPDRYLEDFVKVGGDLLMVHQEACTHLNRTVQKILDLGARAGVALNPATPLVMLEDILPAISRVLIMSINPGFGGQAYIPASTAKIHRCRQLVRRYNPQMEIEVDGGIKATNIKEVYQAGADVLVAGSAIYNKQETVEQAIRNLRAALA